MGVSPERLRRIEESLTREQLLAANAALLRRNGDLETAMKQDEIDLANKVIEGFCEIAVAAANGNPAAIENAEKFLDALRLAQGKPIKLPRVLDTPNGPVVIEAEGKADAIPEPDDEILKEGPDT